MPDIGVPELLIVAVIVILLFGPGKAAGIGQSLGQSIREFRKASHEDDAPQHPHEQLNETGGEGRFCNGCSARLAASQKFCTACGTPA